MTQVFERSFTGNVPIIEARKMEFEAQQHHIWGRLAKFTTPDGKAVNPNKGMKAMSVSNSPVVMQREFQRKMGDQMEIPKMRLLENLPTTGLDQMENREEVPKINHATVPIDILRHAERPKEGTMSQQTTKDYQLIQQVRPHLLRHYSEVSNYLQCSYAMYNGFSYNILNSSRFSGHATIKAISHPHIFVAGDGKVTYGVADYPGTSAYEAAVGTALNTLGSSDIMSVGFLNGLSADDSIRYIQPLHTKNGTPFRILLAHHFQLADLKADTDFRESHSRAFIGAHAKDNPLIAGCQFYVDGWAIYDAGNAIFPVTVPSTTPVWGPSGFTNLTAFRNAATATMFGAIVLGDNALFKGIGQSMRFIKQMKDYDEILGVAYRTVEGYSRGDFWNKDDGTIGAALINEGSAIACTYASKPTI